MSKDTFQVKDRIYFLTKNRKPVAQQIRTKHHPRKPLLHTDEDGTVRELRYATNMNTPFVDEQDGKGVPTLSHVWFRDGILTTKASETPLQKFLALHPDNTENGGKVFFEYNPEAKAQVEIESLEKAASAVSQAKDLDIDDASAVVYSQVGQNISKYSTTEIRRDLLALAMKDPNRLLGLLEDENIKLDWIAFQAINYGVLNVTNNIVTFGNSKKKLMQIKPGETKVEGISAFFLTDDGIATLEEVKAKLKKLLS